MDPFAGHSVVEIRDWYVRVVEMWRHRVPDSLTANLMNHWLTGKGRDLVWKPPAHLMNSDPVKATLETNRQVFLGAEDSSLGAPAAIKSIQDPLDNFRYPFKVWRNCTFGPSRADIDIDLAWSLHGCELHSDVITRISKGRGGWTKQQWLIQFQKCEAWVADVYDWNRNAPNGAERTSPMRNPDYKQSGKERIAPDHENFLVRHSDCAWKVEDAGMATPYKHHSEKWTYSSMSGECWL